MAVRLYMDEHVPRAITAGLRSRGVDVLTAQEDEKTSTADPFLLDRASELGRVVFTRDDDFLVIATHRQHEGIPFAEVVFAHQLRVGIGRCIEDLELIAKVNTLEEMSNQVTFLPL